MTKSNETPGFQNMFFSNDHKFPKELIIQILENMGCEKIQDLDYRNNYNNNRIKPDFECTWKNKPCGVEIGQIGQLQESERHRIRKLLCHYTTIIHIFANKMFPFINVVIYETTKLVDNRFYEVLINQNKICNELLKETNINEEVLVNEIIKKDHKKMIVLDDEDLDTEMK